MLREALLFVCPALIFAQEPAATFKANANLQSIAVQVTDQAGNYVPGLTAQDFTLLEDGKAQKISFFGAEHQPVSLTILVDASRSMDFGGKLDKAKAMLEPLIRGNYPEDEIFIAPFTEKLESFQKLNADQRQQPPVLKVTSADRGTAFYDSLASALCRMKTAQNVRQAVVVITDGADQHSHIRLQQLIEYAQASTPQVFVIGFYNGPEWEIYRAREKAVTLVGERDIDNPVLAFERLAQESGAEAFFPTNDGALKSALDRIISLLQAQYTLAYYPQNLDKFRKIEVRVNKRGLKIAARRGVGSERTDEPVHFANGCDVSIKDHPYPWETHMSKTLANARIYHDDFSDSKSGWPNRSRQFSNEAPLGSAAQAISKTTTVNRVIYKTDLLYQPGGGYQIGRSISANVLVPSPVGDGVIASYGPDWDDFKASVWVDADWTHVETSYLTSAGGMVFHMSEQGYYALVLTGALQFKLIQRTFWDGKTTDVIAATTLARGTGTNHKIEVESKEGKIVLKVDDLEVGHAPDTFKRGMIGLGVFGNGKAVFRDLYVESFPKP